MADDAQHEHTFESVSAGASDTTPTQCSALRKNGYVCMGKEDRPCKIVEMSTSKTGKHGHAKVHLTGIDIFTGKKYDELSPSTHPMKVPEVTRKEYTLLDISRDNFLSLMDEAGNTKDDIELKDGEVKDKITKLFIDQGKDTNVVILTSMGMQVATEAKEAPQGLKYVSEAQLLVISKAGLEPEGQIVGEDEADWGTQGRIVRKKVERIREKTQKVYRGPRAFRLFVQAYQFILWKQCYILIHEKDLPPELWTIIRDLWTLRLSKLLHRLESPDRVGSESQILSSGEERDEDHTRRVSKRVIGSPKLIETLALCYMGILLLRLPVRLQDLYRWAKEEHILYIRAIRGVPIDIQEKLPGEYHKALDTTVMLQPQDLHGAVSDLGNLYYRAFGLLLPPLNYEILLYRYITYLALPLEIFPAVQGLAQLTRSDFRYSITKEIRREQGSAFPEVELMSLLVVAVKLFYPVDDAQRRPQSLHEPATHQMDWISWKRRRQDLAKEPPGTRLVWGSEIDVRDTDVFKMSQQELDSYMNWYQKTWVKEPRPGLEDSVNKDILDMFSLHSLEPSGKLRSMQCEHELEEAAIHRALSTTHSLEFQRPITDDEIGDQEANIKRPGEEYKSYRSEEELPDVVKVFFRAAAETACTSVKNLILAVLQAEAKMTTWKRAKRRAEVTGHEFDLDAEMRGRAASRMEMHVPQEMEATNIRSNLVQREESEENSDVDMQMISS
ncbi:hypothetical protein EPUS_07092 [Endocarpon pusillum Z07020]|uniref:Translation initiation factor 5A C-terminal domain-containing protein n=1 Tax=Endocarpon pusillum (strain Z07020 / HMAS-L-300199) TaxID=1263415 RepID=U1I301_ENDPU|nr:uncharacterized protein EPUS_07092 [Endocarpon pusillum Z07020]ERF76384.1 hypothetical protein EPUS_07092 [Endocarpon pusillum Z07020]